MTRFIWILIGFAPGVAVGWSVTRQYSPEWVGAIGTCIGAVGTIAAIIWAVHTFQQETRNRQHDLGRKKAEKLEREFDLAENVRVICSGGSANGQPGNPTEGFTHSLNNVWIHLANGTTEPATVEYFELPGINFRGNVMRFLPSTLGGGQDFKDTIEVEPKLVGADEVSDRGPLKESIPVLRYRIAGVRWERHGSDPPIRF